MSQSEQIDKFFRILKETKEPAYDVETTGLDWKRCKPVGYSVSDGKDAVYIATDHTGGGNISRVPDFERTLHRNVQEHDGKIVGHNIKFDAHFSENVGIKLGKNIEDTMVNECLINENRRSYSLEHVCKNYDITPKLGKLLYEHIGKQFDVKPDRSSMGHFHRLAGNDPLAVEYAAGDTLTTKQLQEKQKKILYAQQMDVLHNLESELTYVLQKMERRGVSVDLEECAKVKAEVDEMYWKAYAKIPVQEDEYGNVIPMNVRSGKDLKEYFESCEIDDWPMTAPTERFPEGQPSFRKDFLAASQEGLNILNVRKLAHLQSSFLDSLDTHIFNSKIYTTFNQTRGETHGTRSGRLSCSYPNLQQVPKRDKQLGKIYRRIFVPMRDYVLVEYDYSQAEPRLFTHYSDEPALLKGYNSTPFIDMYDVIAAHIYKNRDICKTIGLGIMYTMGAQKLSIQLGISYGEALSILKQLTLTFPKMLGRDKDNPGFTEKAAQVAENRGYVKTILGRRSHFDDPRFSYRAANRIVQGGSADILKYKMIEIDNYLVKNNLEEVCQMLLTIHDALVFQIHKDYLHLVPVIKDILERVQVPPFNLKVPFVATVQQGANWSIASYGEETKKLAA